MFTIENKNVLMIGATAGIGLAVARHFAANGANTVISGRREQGHTIADEIGARFVQMDISEHSQVAPAINAAADMLGNSIDCVIAFAGINESAGGIEALDYAMLRRVFDTNLLGLADALAASSAYVPEGGSIIITSSPASIRCAPYMGAYSASKAALNALTKTWASELAPRNIRVNAVFPGVVKSEMAGGGVPLEIYQATTLNGIIREADEMCGVYHFLASTASSPLTGAIVEADDGVSSSVSLSLINAVASN